MGFDPALRKAQLTRIQGGAQAVHDRISIHLLAGTTGEALSEALSLLRTAPDLPAGTREVCRVLKAMDGNLRRANALLAFAKSGAGSDPLPALAGAVGTEAPPPPGPTARAALERFSPLPEDLAAAAALRPGAETPAPVGDAGFTITLAHLEAMQAAVPATAPPGPASAPARVSVSAAPMPGLDAVAVPSLPAAVAPPNVVTIGAPPKAGSQAQPAPAAVPAGVAVLLPAATPGGAGISKAGSQAPAGTTPAPSPGPITGDVPVPPDLWLVAAHPTDVSSQGATGATPERAGIAVTVPVALPGRARLPENQPGPALVAAPVAPVAALPANTGTPAAVLVPAPPAAASTAPAQATTVLPATSPTGLPDRVAPAVAPVRQETPAVAAAGVGLGGTPAAGSPGTVVVAPALPATPAGVPDAIAGAVVATPAVPAGAMPVAGTGGAPATVNAVRATARTGGAAAAPAGVAAGAVEATIALERVAADPSRAEEVWAEGRLTGDVLIRFLDGAPLKWEDATCTAVAGLLARHCADKIADTNTLSAKVRTWLGVHYRLAKDAKCIALYENVLAEKGLPGYTIEVALCGLAWYYRSVGDYRTAAEVFLREEKLSSEPANIANGLLEAARLYTDMGDEKTASELYAKVAQHGYGWATGMALCDQARSMMAQGRHHEARELLQRPVTGRYADQIQVAMLSLIGTSFYREGRLSEAERYSRKAIAQYQSLVAPLKGEGLEGVLNETMWRLHWLERWHQQPIYCDPDGICLMVGQDERSAARSVTVMAPNDAPLVVDTSVQGTKASLTSDWMGRTGLYRERQLLVEFQTNRPVADTDGLITISSPGFPGFRLTVPLHVRVRPSAPGSITVTPGTAFFGFVKPIATVDRELRITSHTPFRLTGVRADGDAVTVVPGATSTNTEHLVSVRFHAKDSVRGCQEGRVRIETDMPVQPIVEIRYAAMVE